MSSNQEGELLNELLNEQSYIQKLKLRATKQHRRIRDNMGEVFDGLMGSLRDRRRSLLATLTEITEELELQLTSIETAISSDVIRLQDLIQEVSYYGHTPYRNTLFFPLYKNILSIHVSMKPM